MIGTAHVATALIALFLVLPPCAAAACSDTASCGNACEVAPPCHTTGGAAGDSDCCSAASDTTPAATAPAAGGAR